jgi:hypothetical protein
MARCADFLNAGRGPLDRVIAQSFLESLQISYDFSARIVAVWAKMSG